MTVHITHSINQELKTKGFSFQSGSLVTSLINASNNDVKQFKNEWNELGEDNYLQSDYMFRYRRYGQIGFIPSEKKFWKREDTTYFQSSDINSYAGGLDRQFAPLTDRIVNSEVFRNLIATSFDTFAVEEDFLDQEWFVDIHLFRLITEDIKETSPTPEGIHRDGFPFGALHLLDRQNIEGGVSRVHTLDEELLGIRTLEAPLDSFYCFDDRVKHFTTALVANGMDKGHRDVLVYGFHLPGTKYEKG